MIGQVLKQIVGGREIISSPLSSYIPSSEVRDLTFRVKQAYSDGDNIQNTSFQEFNGMSVVSRMNEDQRAWLSWSNPAYEGEDDWRWTGVRPITRNKVISTAANLTSQLLFPNIFAQNDAQEEDKDAANVMRELIEYNIKNSNYETCFLYGVIAGLVNPVSYWKVDYTQNYQELWNEGKKEKVIDDLFSGFQHSLIPADEILIANAYQYDIQKQDFIIHKRRISYGEAEARYGENEQFKHVRPGVFTILGEDATFYDVEDINDDLVEEVCYKSRRADEEVYFVNGVFMGENATFNPMYHRTNENKPKYNLVKYGAEPIDAMRFFYYKSLVAKMSNDQEAVDREWQMYFDAGFLATFPPTITMGAGKIDKSVIAPATTTDLPMNAKIEPLNIANPNAALQALREAERSVVESSMDTQGAGSASGNQKTARESILLQQNMQTNLGIMGKMIGTMVKEVGILAVDDIIRYQTVGQASEITGEMSYKTFIIDGHVKGGKSVTSYIRFTDRLLGKFMTKEERRKANLRLYEEAGDDKEIYEVNPEAFAKMKYLITIDADALLQRNDAFERAFKLEIYDRAIASPLIQSDPESMNKITRDFLLEPLVRGEASKYLPDVAKVAQPLIPKAQGQGLGMTKRVVAGSGIESMLGR